jgi:tellurite resistance protein TehA-like permease
MTVSGLLPLLIFFVWLVMLPFVFGQVFAAALIKFKLEPTTALLVVIGITWEVRLTFR